MSDIVRYDKTSIDDMNSAIQRVAELETANVVLLRTMQRMFNTLESIRNQMHILMDDIEETLRQIDPDRKDKKK